ncbi:MAG: hypothetical protein WAT92_14495 [Saprospiraceae bacterium]
MIIERVENIFNYYHLLTGASLFSVLMNSYFKFVDLNDKLLLSSFIVLGIISCIISILYKIEIKQNFEKTNTVIFEYKNSRIPWSTLSIGLLLILLTLTSNLDNSELKILTLSIGIYLIFSQMVDFIFGKYFSTNILAFNYEILVDLNGGIKRIKSKDIISYSVESELIVIQEKYDRYKIRKEDFMKPENMLEQIEINFLSNRKLPKDNKIKHL